MYIALCKRLKEKNMEENKTIYLNRCLKTSNTTNDFIIIIISVDVLKNGFE